MPANTSSLSIRALPADGRVPILVVTVTTTIALGLAMLNFPQTSQAAEEIQPTANEATQSSTEPKMNDEIAAQVTEKTEPTADATGQVNVNITLEADQPEKTTEEKFLDGYRALILRNYEEAIAILAPLGDAGHTRAAYHLSQIYWEGHGVKRNSRAAVSWLKIAAHGNHVQAQFELGALYETGNGVDVDYSEAARWMGMAADAGLPDATFLLGYYHREGKGVIKDDQQAFVLVRKSVELGMSHVYFLDGLFYLGAAHEWGRGVPTNLVEAYKWYILAASYSRTDSEQHIEAGRAMGALRTRMSRNEIHDAHSRAQEWRVTRTASARARHEPVLLGKALLK